MEETLSRFMSESAKRHEENFNLIKEIRASTDATISNQRASIKTLEIQIGQMSKVLQDRGFRSLPSSTETNPRDHVKSISTIVEADSNSIRRLGELAHTKLTVELADRTVKYSKEIAENVLVGIGKFIFLTDFIILDMPKDIKVPLILRRPFLSTACAKIDVFKRKITLRVREEKIIFKSVKPASSLIKRVYMLSLRERMELDLEARLMGETLVLNRSFDPFFEDYIELNDLNVPLELRKNKVDYLMSTIEEGECMRTRNSYFPNNLNVTILRRRNRNRVPKVVEPELRTIVAPMAERTMEELLRAPTEGYREAIVLPEINADHFEIKTNMLQLNVPNDVIKLMIFPYSLEGAAKTWYEKEPQNSILTWEDLVTKFVNQFFPPSKTTHLKNEISRFTQKFEETFSEAWERFKELLRACPHHGFTELTQVDTFYNGLNENEQDSLNAAAGGNLLSKTTREALNIIENKSKVRYSRNRSNVSRMNATSSKTDERIDKLADQLSTLVEIVSKKVVTPAPVKAVEESCVTCGGAHSWYNCLAIDNNQASVCATTGTYNQINPPNRVSNQMAPPGFAPVQNNGQNSAQIPPPVIPISILKPDVLKTLPKTTPILELDVPKNLRFDISFANALLLMPRFAPTIKSLLMNKEKLLELAKILLNENSSAMLLKKLPEKLRDPGKFLIPCNFPGMDVCHALADLGASINLMPLSIWKNLSLPDLTPTRMTLELANQSITYPKGLAEDVFVKVGKFHFPTDFVVVDFEVDPRVPLILGRSFLRTSRALIDVYGEEITLRVNNEVVTFNLDQTTRYSSTNDKSINRIDIIDAVCEEYALELLGFSNFSCGNPTPTSDPFTSKFILEEIEAFLKDDSISPEIDHADCDPEEDIFLIEKLLNNDPFQLPLMDLKQSEVTEAKSSIEEPPELKLKDLPSHLEYAFLEENDKLPVIIAKGLKNDENDALLKVLQSHKRAIAWKITDIK
ncbi:reverse transcriptase domain-containing protein, partial [Tanacetum coccineum]